VPIRVAIIDDDVAVRARFRDVFGDSNVFELAELTAAEVTKANSDVVLIGPDVKGLHRRTAPIGRVPTVAVRLRQDGSTMVTERPPFSTAGAPQLHEAAAAHAVAQIVAAAEPLSRLSLAADVASPAHARGFVRRWCRWSDHHALGDDLALVASELVTNALQHAASPSEMSLRPTTSGVRIEVSDRSARMLASLHPLPHGDHGRGLTLVDRLSCRWGVDPSPCGKVVWAELTSLPSSGAA
jgi:anti-sigma regulatory factor (Ser/Thr protein kinase)